MDVKTYDVPHVENTWCPGCERNLRDTLKESGSSLEVYDVIEILARAIQVRG